jgi:hypothetical protein
MQMGTLTDNEKAELMEWYLKDQGYEQGVALYMKYGKNKNLKRQFVKKETDYLRNKVASEMIKIIEQVMVNVD